MPTDGLPLGPEVPNFKHHFEEQPGAEYLVISFSGLATDPAKPNTGWAQRARLAALPVHRLFVESQARPLPDPCFDLDGLGEFVEAARACVGVDAAQTVTCGSSLGATASLESATRWGYGLAVVGSPIVLIGDYVEDEALPEMVRSSVSRSFAESSLESRNARITGTLQNAPGPTTIDFFVGDGDHFFPDHLNAVRSAVATNEALDLRVTVAPGVTHADMYRAWSRHLAASLHRLLGLPEVVAEPAA
jgi:hypothetical protein